MPTQPIKIKRKKMRKIKNFAILPTLFQNRGEIGNKTFFYFMLQ